MHIQKAYNISIVNITLQYFAMDRCYSNKSMQQILKLCCLDEINNFPPKVPRKNPANPRLESVSQKCSSASLKFHYMQDRPTQRRHHKLFLSLCRCKVPVSMANTLRERHQTLVQCTLQGYLWDVYTVCPEIRAYGFHAISFRTTRKNIPRQNFDWRIIIAETAIKVEYNVETRHTRMLPTVAFYVNIMRRSKVYQRTFSFSVHQGIK